MLKTALTSVSLSTETRGSWFGLSVCPKLLLDRPLSEDETVHMRACPEAEATALIGPRTLKG